MLAQLQSLVEEDQPHPRISLAPPTETVIVHVQPDNVSTLQLIFIGILNSKKHFFAAQEGTTDGKCDVHRQNSQMVKDQPIRLGAYCSCFLAQHIKTGTIIVAKQVSVVLLYNRKPYMSHFHTSNQREFHVQVLYTVHCTYTTLYQRRRKNSKGKQRKLAC